MIASFAMMLLGTMTKLPDLVRSLVARQVTSATRPSNSPTRIQCADAKRLLALDAEAGKRVPERVLQREADDHGADRRRREELVVEDERRDEHQQADDDRVLEDRREGIGHAVRAQRVDEAETSRLITAAAKTSRSRARKSPSSAGKEAGPLPDDEVEEDVAGEKKEGKPELSLDEPVDGEAADRERRGQSRDAHDQVVGIVDQASPFWNSAMSLRGRSSPAHGSCSGRRRRRDRG